MALGTAALTAAAGGDVGDIVRATVVSFASAAAFHAVGQEFGNPKLLSPKHFAKTLAHGTVGGVMSAASGGKFKDGFLAAAAGQFGAPAIDGLPTVETRVAAAAVVGGTASKLGGGKFANGAVAGAFGRLYNEEHDRRRINPQPGGPDGPKITFNNDILGGRSTNLPVDPDLATAIEQSVSNTGFDININSTTGGHFSGPHTEGRAADINRLNNLRVDNPLNVDSVRILQEELIRHPNTNQVLGPILNVNKWHNAPQPTRALIDSHRNHIHVNVPR